MYLACLGFGLALHAHPTTLPLGLLLVLAFPRIGPAGAGRVWKIILCVALILLPFAPLLVDASTHSRDFAGFARGIASALDAFRPGNAIPVIANIFWHVPNLVVDSYLGDVAIIAVVWRIFLSTMHVVVLVGVGLALTRSELALRTLTASALAYTLFSALVIVAVRNETRFYMVYALMPSIAFVQALGLTACARSGWRGVRPLVDGLLGAAIVGFVALAGARFIQAGQGAVRLPALFGGQMDLRTGPKTGYARLDSLPLWDLDALGRALCEAGSIRAYGDLTIIVDSQFNVPARVHCGERARVVLGGLPGPGEMRCTCFRPRRFRMSAQRGATAPSVWGRSSQFPIPDAASLLRAVTLIRPGRCVGPRQFTASTSPPKANALSSSRRRSRHNVR